MARRALYIQWTQSIEHHRCRELVGREQVSYSATCHAQKGGPGETIEESRHEHCLNVSRNSARYNKRDEADQRCNVHRFAAIELPQSQSLANTGVEQTQTSLSGARIIGLSPSPTAKIVSPSVASISEM